jgi:GT2 family glycosyltransferase
MLSVIIPARNEGMMTQRCLDAALYTVSKLKLKCEFILVDDASEPGERIQDVFARFRVTAREHEVRIVRSRTHRHYTGVFSIGLHLSTRPLIFFLSNDMMVTPSFLGALLMVSALHPEFGIVRGTSNHTDSHPEYQVIPTPMPATYPAVDMFSRRIADANGCDWREDPHLSGDAVLIRRELVQRIGVLDTDFFGYFGDVDYGMRARLAGFKLVCALGAWLFHSGAGHVLREAQQRGEKNVAEAYERRMALVDAAYRVFQNKWPGTYPDVFTHLPAIGLAALERDNAARGSLRHELPPALLADLEFR